MQKLEPSKKKTKFQWNSKSLAMTCKKAHSKDLISVSACNQNMFYTSSTDHTVRLWDIRVGSSVKLITDSEWKNCEENYSLSNCENDRQQKLFVGFGKKLFAFDVRMEKVFVDKSSIQSKQNHFEDIQCLKFNPELDTLAVGDHHGDIRLYAPGSLEERGRLDQTHSNICNSVDFSSLKAKLKHRVLYTGGFDCRLLQWNVEQNSLDREVDLKDLFAKYEVKILNSMPFIHHIHCHENSVIVSTETGHVLCLSCDKVSKPKFIMEASLVRVNHSTVTTQNGSSLMMCLNSDDSFSLFDFLKRGDGTPKFIQKYAVPFEPISTAILPENQVFLMAGYSPELAIFKIKQ